MYLLPKDDPIMKRIIDENLAHCDIYVRETSLASQKQQVEEFHRFVETHLNKIKRVKKPRVRIRILTSSWLNNLADKMSEA